MFIHLHLLSTTVTHCISLVFILSATGKVIQHSHMQRVLQLITMLGTFSRCFCDLLREITRFHKC